MGESATTVLTFLGSLVTAALAWIGEVVEFIVSQPLILVPMMVFFIVGGTIGLVNRLIRG